MKLDLENRKKRLPKIEIRQQPSCSFQSILLSESLVSKFFEILFFDEVSLNALKFSSFVSSLNFNFYKIVAAAPAAVPVGVA